MNLQTQQVLPVEQGLLILPQYPSSPPASGGGLSYSYGSLPQFQVLKTLKVFSIVFCRPLPVQSVSTTTKALSSNPDHDQAYSIQHYVIKFVSDLRQVVVISGFLHQ